MKNYAIRSIKQDLLNFICDRGLQGNDRLPTTIELCAMLDASKQTVQEVLRQLKQDGILEVKKGKGILLKEKPALKSRGRKIGLVFQGSLDYLEMLPWPAEVILPLEKILNDHSFELISVPLREFANSLAMDNLKEQAWAGLILFEIDNDRRIVDFCNLNVPMVSVDYDATRLGIPSVAFDNRLGVFRATKKLIELGHRRIMFIHEVRRSMIGNRAFVNAVEGERMDGYRLAMQDAHLPIWIEKFDEKALTILQLIGKIFHDETSPTALVTTGDHVALVCAREILGLGLKIPEDVSLIGFGGYHREYAPGLKLGTVKVNHASMAEWGAHFMLEQMKQAQEEAELKLLETDVILFDSVGDMISSPGNIPVDVSSNLCPGGSDDKRNCFA